ncbi:MAG: HDIG domain-containing protein [Paludibacteraceae bacterium]|nr:HDIG domain-containing protein [Paludibacteraceae bacterium]
MDTIALLQKYCGSNEELFEILSVHARKVTDKALQLAAKHPELDLDQKFVEEAAMLHDIGIVQCHAPSIHCNGEHPYICHGYLGADILRSEGLERHALVAERHTGTGLTRQYIVEQGLPLPLDRIYEPVSLEEILICYADKFFSKTHLYDEKLPEKIEASLAKWGDASVERFQTWSKLLG